VLNISELLSTGAHVEVFKGADTTVHVTGGTSHVDQTIVLQGFATADDAAATALKQVLEAAHQLTANP
jgi:hypothetical protein